MNFGEALEALKAGKKVTHKAWENSEKYIFLNVGYVVPNAGHDYDITELDRIFLKRNSNDLIYGWKASHWEILADDWEVWDELSKDSQKQTDN